MLCLPPSSALFCPPPASHFARHQPNTTTHFCFLSCLVRHRGWSQRRAGAQTLATLTFGTGPRDTASNRRPRLTPRSAAACLQTPRSSNKDSKNNKEPCDWNSSACQGTHTTVLCWYSTLHTTPSIHDGGCRRRWERQMRSDLRLREPGRRQTPPRLSIGPRLSAVPPIPSWGHRQPWRQQINDSWPCRYVRTRTRKPPTCSESAGCNNPLLLVPNLSSVRLPNPLSDSSGLPPLSCVFLPPSISPASLLGGATRCSTRQWLDASTRASCRLATPSTHTHQKTPPLPPFTRIRHHQRPLHASSSYGNRRLRRCRFRIARCLCHGRAIVPSPIDIGTLSPELH